MNDEWTPISEPPKHQDDVVLWVDVDQGYWIKGFYEKGKWYNTEGERIWEIERATHYKKITPPK